MECREERSAKLRIRRKARIRASEVCEPALAMRELDTFSNMVACYARWRVESGSTTSPLTCYQKESASSFAGHGVLGKAAVISEMRSKVLAIDAK
jgi:hypothetical protein